MGGARPGAFDVGALDGTVLARPSEQRAAAAVLGERIRRVQEAGVLATLVGVALIAAG